MSKFTDIEIFEILKKTIANRFLEENSAQSEKISDWKGQEITSFQDDLFNKTRSTVSEKWFYTYFKSDFKKLPRIDMLNLLAQYCGFKNWAHFVQTQKNEQLNSNQPTESTEKAEETEKEGLEGTTSVELESEIKQEVKGPIKKETVLTKDELQQQKPKLKLISILVATVVLLSGIGAAVYYTFFSQREYEFCFVDSDRQSKITNSVEVTIIRDGFTPLYLSTKTGCIKFESQKDTIKMFVSSPYYKQDTFKVNLHQYNQPEKLLLEPDDYKIMLYYYSNSAKDLKQRISKLNQMIADDALIYQVYDNDFFGVEILSKQQYINLVTMPTTSLKNFSLIESESKKGKIVKLKFKIQQDENDK
ncbi:hypothetical protein [Empedobacter brevis]|uniref:Uncharacterized protein n=1 Tax=Empedobacter brevis NBRC 14943 = ATCC 43319 TaxID=1218108 RepID=A0A511NHG0_9FLAO|nr:hypothetical protein [Empedobacter brevis]QHC83692.1 hypothetical protein AS589_02250 [Empedobacter brevis]GEM52250.1 hypothetical protein EB1_20400 [Empedobacter brevis NBRC 14943 = ATCC 43319]